MHILETEQFLRRPRDEVFAFFADAGNLDVITPPWLNFRILTPLPIEMKAGALIEYRLKVHGIPVFWRTEIAEWTPPVSFVDRQLKGPYRQWVHTHRFEERDGGTWIHDRVEYLVPGWLLSPWIHRWMVGPDLEKIFAYRKQAIETRFRDAT